jgi:hypothetical protein
LPAYDHGFVVKDDGANSARNEKDARDKRDVRSATRDEGIPRSFVNGFLPESAPRVYGWLLFSSKYSLNKRRPAFFARSPSDRFPRSETNFSRSDRADSP